MHALRLTTRFKENAYQGEACLLVYDEQHLSGAILSEDVRDQFESRPATGRIYIAAPFTTETAIRECFHEGALFERVKSYFHKLGGRLYFLTFREDGNTKQCYAVPFTVNKDGNEEEEPAVLVEAELRNGWLFDLFDKFQGKLEAPVGVHFGKSSGKHSDKFLRVSSILLSSSACAIVGFFTLGLIPNMQPKRIFVDTAPLISVAFAIQRIALKHEIWFSEVPVNSFSSYGGVNDLPNPSSRDLILVSASTSGNLITKLTELEFDASNIGTLFFLRSTASSSSQNNVVCDLTFNVGQSYGYPAVESHAPNSCPLCAKGYFLAELEGDQFQLEKRAVKKLAIKKITQSADARIALELLAKKELFHVDLFGAKSANSEITIDAGDMLQKVPEIRAKTIRAFKRHIPTPLNLIVLVDIEKNVLEEIFDHAQIREHIKATEIIDSSQLSKVDPLPAGGALVVFGYLNDFSKARHINAQLRTIVPEGFVFYFSALTVANSAQHLADLKMFLTFGEHGRDTFTYDAAYSLMLPSQSEYVPAWQAELELLQQLRNEGSYPAEVEERLDLLVETQKRSTSLFWPGGSGELEIKNDFVFLNTTDDRASITQADIFATISNLLACSRMDNKGLTSAPLSGEQIKWQQSVYGQALLAPENFENYNDAVLRAAFLRAAHPSELQYFSDANASFQIFTLIKAQILGWSKGIGDSLPEFLISLATKRLALSAKHMSEIKTLLTGDELPSYIKVLASKI